MQTIGQEEGNSDGFGVRRGDSFISPTSPPMPHDIATYRRHYSVCSQTKYVMTILFF